MIKIKFATVEDAALIAALNVDVQTVHATALPQLFKKPMIDAQLVQEFRSNLEKPDCFILIAEMESNIAGYLSAECQLWRDSPRAHQNKVVYVHHLSVSEAFRRRGIGRALLDEARKRGSERGITRLALDVWRFNEPARKFFAGYGLDVYNEKMWMEIG